MKSKQVLRFGSAVLQALPDIPADLMQKWIENPTHLQNALYALNDFGTQFITRVGNFGIGIAGSCRDVFHFYKTDTRVRLSETFREKFVENHLIRGSTLLPEISLKFVTAKALTQDINFRQELPEGHVFFDTTIMLGVIQDLIVSCNLGHFNKKFPNLFFVEQKRGGDITTISIKRDGSGVWEIDCHHPGTELWPTGSGIFFPAN